MSLDLIKPNGQTISFTKINLDLFNSDPIHRIRGRFSLAKPSITEVKFVSNLHGDFIDPLTTRATFKFKISNMLLSDWRFLFQSTQFSAIDGNVSAEVSGKYGKYFLWYWRQSLY